LPQRRIYGPNCIIKPICSRITPLSDFDIDLISPIRTYVRRGVLKKTKDNILIQAPQRRIDFKLKSPKIKTIFGKDFCCVPLTVFKCQFKMKISIFIHKRVIFFPIIVTWITNTIWTDIPVHAHKLYNLHYILREDLIKITDM